MCGFSFITALNKELSEANQGYLYKDNDKRTRVSDI